MDTYEDDRDWSFQPTHQFKVIIVGAGIAGLVSAIGLRKAGHGVVVLEQAREIAEAGAGIQLAPNAARIMGRLGLLGKIMQKSNVLRMNSLRRWQDGQEIRRMPLMPAIGKKYKAPIAVIHRGDLQSILLQAVKDLAIHIRFNSKVIEVDPSFSARVKLASGEWVEGDVVIAGDGIKSDVRKQISLKHGISDEPQPTGDAAYRIQIPQEKMENDPEALELLNSEVGIRWMGPGGHIMAYPIKNSTVYNMVLLHPAKPNQGVEESWTTKGNKKEMIEIYKYWNVTISKLLSYVPAGEVMDWTLNSYGPLPSWVENKCVLAGDACHPMLPYVAQGAAQAIEDAAVLTCALSLTDNIDVALRVYEGVRKDRAERTQNSATETRRVIHLPDGEEQQQRDAAMAGSLKDGAHNPDLWADREWQEFMWGTDVMKDTVDNWESWVAKVEGGVLRDLKTMG